MATKQEWFVYRAINDNKQEIFHGITTEPLDKILDQCVKKSKFVKDWDFNKDRIIVKIVSYEESQQEALDLSNSLEIKYKSYKGYKNIQTTGIKCWHLNIKK